RSKRDWSSDVCSSDLKNASFIHGGRPLWMNEAFFLVRRHKNLYMDISGIPPQKLLAYFPRIEEIADKVLWGTDWPGPGVPEIKEIGRASCRERVERAG